MLTAIRLKNCQSWDDTIINLSTDRPNILVADNNVGKSVIFKMLKITANPKIFSAEERRNLIRFGEEFALFVCQFDDNALGVTLVYPNKVLYRYKGPKENELQTYSEPPDDFLDHLSLIRNSKTNFLANIIDTDQDLFLVNTKSSGDAELMKLLAEEPALNEVSNKIDNLLDLISAENRQLITKEIILKQQIESTEVLDSDTIKYQIERGTALFEILKMLVSLYDYLDLITAGISDYTDYNYCLYKLGLIDSLLNIDIQLDLCKFDEQIKDYDYEIGRLFVLDYLSKAESLLQLTNVDLNDYSIEGYKIQFLELVNRLCENIHNLYLARITDKSLCREIDEIKEIINQSGFIVNCPIKGEVLYINEQCLPYSD